MVAGLVFLIILPLAAIELNEILGWLEWEYLFLDVVGAIFILAGGIIFLYCTGLFHKWGRGTPAPIEPPEELVEKGIYKYSRNPMYIGYFFILFGEFLFFGEVLLLVYSVFIVLFINIYLRIVEEPKLEKRFGREYKEYMKRVPRWFGFLQNR